MLDEPTSYRGSFQELADARAALKAVIPLDKCPVLDAGQRLELHKIKSLAILVIGAAVAELVDTLDVLDGDLDAEDATGAEDAFEDHEERYGYAGPGDPISDPGGGNVEDDGEAVDEREPDHGAEIETWSHPDDHPAELFVGRRPEPPEAA